MVRESASSPTWEKPWRSYSSIAPALLRSTLSEIDPWPAARARSSRASSRAEPTPLPRAREDGYPSISLSVDRNNAGAIELYQRRGFAQVGEDADSLTMRAALDSTHANEGTDTE